MFIIKLALGASLFRPLMRGYGGGIEIRICALYSGFVRIIRPEILPKMTGEIGQTH